MKYNFPKFELSEGERLWLGMVSKYFLQGYLADPDRLKKSLHSQGKWPKGLRPSEIDTRLLRESNKPTLLGIWHAYPENEWIPKLDQLVAYLKERILSSTSARINVSDIAAALDLPHRSVSTLVRLLPSIGLYYTATSVAAPMNRVAIPGDMGVFESIQLDDPERMDKYLSYEGIEQQMKALYGEPLDVFIGFTESDKQIALKMQSLLKTIFGAGCKVFVASDRDSMVPGDWFNHVVSKLKETQVLIVLVSEDSHQKEWINYETGVVEGAAKHHDQRGFAQNILPESYGTFPKLKCRGRFDIIKLVILRTWMISVGCLIKPHSSCKRPELIPISSNSSKNSRQWKNQRGDSRRKRKKRHLTRELNGSCSLVSQKRVSKA